MLILEKPNLYKLNPFESYIMNKTEYVNFLILLLIYVNFAVCKG